MMVRVEYDNLSVSPGSVAVGEALCLVKPYPHWLRQIVAENDCRESPANVDRALLLLRARQARRRFFVRHLISEVTWSIVIELCHMFGGDLDL